jgi:hypothetical protein
MDYSKLIEQLDAEIARLKEARDLLGSVELPKAVPAKRFALKKSAKRNAGDGRSVIKHAKKTPAKFINRNRSGGDTGDGGYGYTKEKV